MHPCGLPAAYRQEDFAKKARSGHHHKAATGQPGATRRVGRAFPNLSNHNRPSKHDRVAVPCRPSRAAALAMSVLHIATARALDRALNWGQQPSKTDRAEGSIYRSADSFGSLFGSPCHFLTITTRPAMCR